MRNSYWMLALMFVAASAATLAAQPATDNKPSADQSEFKPAGADTAKDAATGFFDALKAKDVKKLLNYMPPERFAGAGGAAQAEAQCKMFCAATTLTEYKLGEVKEAGNSATATYTWKITVDADSLLESMLALQKEMAAAQGKEITDEQLEQAKSFMTGMVAKMKEQMEGSEQTMTLAKSGDKWFVQSPTQRAGGRPR